MAQRPVVRKASDEDFQWPPPAQEGPVPRVQAPTPADVDAAENALEQEVGFEQGRLPAAARPVVRRDESVEVSSLSEPREDAQPAAVPRRPRGGLLATGRAERRQTQRQRATRIAERTAAAATSAPRHRRRTDVPPPPARSRGGALSSQAAALGNSVGTLFDDLQRRKHLVAREQRARLRHSDRRDVVGDAYDLDIPDEELSPEDRHLRDELRATLPPPQQSRGVLGVVRDTWNFATELPQELIGEVRHTLQSPLNFAVTLIVLGALVGVAYLSGETYPFVAGVGLVLYGLMLYLTLARRRRRGQRFPSVPVAILTSMLVATVSFGGIVWDVQHTQFAVVEQAHLDPGANNDWVEEEAPQVDVAAATGLPPELVALLVNVRTNAYAYEGTDQYPGLLTITTIKSYPPKDAAWGRSTAEAVVKDQQADGTLRLDSTSRNLYGARGGEGYPALYFTYDATVKGTGVGNLLTDRYTEGATLKILGAAWRCDHSRTLVIVVGGAQTGYDFQQTSTGIPGVVGQNSQPPDYATWQEVKNLVTLVQC